jgi:hypothetical protein
MRWSVTLVAEGDRIVTLEEVVELADAVAIHHGIASGMGTNTYGAQIVVEALTTDEAIAAAMPLFTAAARKAGLPVWPVTTAEAEGDEEEMEWYDEIPEGSGLSNGHGT